jgi:DNA-binding transcriptional LysR family regulator
LLLDCGHRDLAGGTVGDIPDDGGRLDAGVAKGLQQLLDTLRWHGHQQPAGRLRVAQHHPRCWGYCAAPLDDEIVLIVPAGHELAQQRALTPARLAHETLIVREPGSATRNIAEANLARLGIAPRQVLELSGCEAVKRAVSAGLGVAFVSAIRLRWRQRSGCCAFRTSLNCAFRVT